MADIYMKNITIIENNIVFTDENEKIHRINKRVNKNGFIYIIYKNRHIYFRVFSQCGNYNLAPYIRNGSKVKCINSKNSFELNSLNKFDFLNETY